MIWQIFNARDAQWGESALNMRIREKIKAAGRTFLVNFFHLTCIRPSEKLYYDKIEQCIPKE